MNLERVTKAYRMVRRVVSPDSLLLDPTNPRLITDSAQYHRLSPPEIAATSTQAEVLRMVTAREHGVKQLIDSIAQFGFMTGLQQMIVRRLGSDGRYLVLEGNRRTAAIKSLLERKSTLPADVRLTIQQVEVQEFIYLPNAEFSEDAVIDVLLGTIHIEGPREWGPMAKAQYIFRTYMRELGTRRFMYDSGLAKLVGSTFKVGPRDLKKLLSICRVYEQLREAGLPVQPVHYSLIELAVKTRVVAEDVFEVDHDACVMSEAGLERFAQLCLLPGHPITNPKLFQSFAYICAEGSEQERLEVLSRTRKLDDVLIAARERKRRRAFREDLTRIRELLGELRVAEFNGTTLERDEIRRICRIVGKQLLPLLGRDGER